MMACIPHRLSTQDFDKFVQVQTPRDVGGSGLG
jgi:hypothetical protein